MCKWRFVSNQNSTIVGINDAGIETFTANMNRSLIREIIQNSLDAVIPNSKSPVTVEFSCFKINKESFPDYGNFKSIIERCKQSNENEPDAFKYFENAENILLQPEIQVLRISDHNTRGLEGSDTCEKGSSWSRLVKETGSSNKGQSSGGSFGIGKSAAFACSDLRTVFYSSLDCNGLESNIGVARLVSFEQDGYWTTGVGYYSYDETFVAMNELAALDESYERYDCGTDIYILGMHTVEDFKKTFIKSVLLDFLVSLIRGKLIVDIQGEIIDKNTLHKYVAELNPHESSEIKDLILYYELLTSKNPNIKRISLDSKKYGKDYGFSDGECTLYLREGDGLNRKILITRNAGMRIFEQDHISGSIDFTGVLIIDGAVMNETFKKMEVPSHDAWEPGRCRGEEKYYKAIYEGLRKYLRDEVKNIFGRVTTKVMDAIGVSDFLPDEKKDGDKLNKDELSLGIKSLIGKMVEPTNSKSKNSEDVEMNPEETGNNSQSKGNEKEGGEGTGSGQGTKGESNRGGNEKGSNGAEGKNKIGYKEIKVKKRLICSNQSQGIYVLSFVVPTNASKGRLDFSISGEQSDFDLPISSAKVIVDGKTRIDEIKDNKVFLENMEQGKALKIEIKVDFNNYCMMEVGYYAN